MSKKTKTLLLKNLKRDVLKPRLKWKKNHEKIILLNKQTEKQKSWLKKFYYENYDNTSLPFDDF